MVSTLDYEVHFSLNSALTKGYVPVVRIHSEIAKHSRDLPLVLLERPGTTILLLERPASIILLLHTILQLVERPATQLRTLKAHSIAFLRGELDEEVGDDYHEDDKDDNDHYDQ